jgi:hypothetical protein
VIRLRHWAPLFVALVVLWAVVGYLLTKPTDFHDYRKAAVQSAESGYNAVSTAEITVRAQLDDKVTGPFSKTTLDWASSAVAGAWKQFAGVAPVDEATTAMRDELGPILLSAVRVLGDLTKAEDSGSPAATAHALGQLGPVADQLSGFLEQHK